MSEPTPTYRTGLGTSNADAITLLGHDLAHELIGRISFGELAFWLVAKRRPDPGQLVLFEAVLVSLADHGFTPTAIASRLTYASAPDSLQGALAAGLLGGGSRFLGVTEDCAQFLAAALAELPLSVRRRVGRVGELDGPPGVPDDPTHRDALSSQPVSSPGHVVLLSVSPAVTDADRHRRGFPRRPCGRRPPTGSC